MLKLFAAKHTVSLASALILEELGTEYELCLVDIAARAQREKPYLDINPKGRVPTLVTPDGFLQKQWRFWNILRLILCRKMPSPAPRSASLCIIWPQPCM